MTIGVSAFDTRAIAEVYPTVALPGGGTANVPLQGVSSSRYEGVFTAPANAGTVAMQYAIEITALDDIGQPAFRGCRRRHGGRSAQQGAVAVRRLDGGQPNLALRLTGRGISGRR